MPMPSHSFAVGVEAADEADVKARNLIPLHGHPEIIHRHAFGESCGADCYVIFTDGTTQPFDLAAAAEGGGEQPCA